MLLALPAFFVTKKRYLFPYILLVGLYLLSIIWYYRNYGTIMPLASYAMFHNLSGLGPSILHSMRLADLWVAGPLFCYLVFYALFLRRAVGMRFRKTILSACVALLFVSGVSAWPFITYRPTDYYHTYRFFNLEPVRAFKQYGLIDYWLYQKHFMDGCTRSEKELLCRFMEQACKQDCEPLVSHNKNLIVILIESMCNWPLEYMVDGRPVMSNLNCMIREENTLYFPKVLPQVKDGRSSDAQLLINTGLLPVNTGATASLYAQNAYFSLPKALSEKGYLSASFTCEGRLFWNQEAMTKAYGFSYLYDNLSDGDWICADERLFGHCLPPLDSMKQPFYAQIVTISSHAPYVKSRLSERSALDGLSFVSDDVKYYLIAMEYADRCLGDFIGALKGRGLYDNSIVVITGDHDDETYNRCEGREEVDLQDRFVPLIVLNAPPQLKPECDNVIGQVDIYPTLLDLMGVGNYPFRGLGESVFRNQTDCAIYHTGKMAGNCMNDSIVDVKKRLWTVSDILIREDYFRP